MRTVVKLAAESLQALELGTEEAHLPVDRKELHLGWLPWIVIREIHGDLFTAGFSHTG